MKKLIILLFLLNTFIVTAQQTLNFTIQHDNLTREYTLYIPASYTGNSAVPLLFNLHGYTSNKDQQIFYGDFRPIADTANFIICLPNGTFDGSNNRFWNAGFGGTIDDVGFIMSLLDHLEATYNIDATRVYSTGMSNGGFMSLTLACAKSDRVTAVASVTGSMTILQKATCNPSRPIPVMQIHGTADATVPYVGNAQTLHQDSLVKYWVNENGCNASPTVTPVPNTNTSDGCTATRYDYGGCQDNTKVAFYKIDGGGHTWPGASFSIPNINTNKDFNASLEIWNFFMQFTNPDITTDISEKMTANKIELYPNPANNLLSITFSDKNDKFQAGIYDLNGKFYLSKELSNKESIDISSLGSGIYFLSLKNNSAVVTKKFVKE